MASALSTLADGGGTAVAVGGSGQPAGLNITAGNTANGQILDMSGVTGYTVRSIWNNQGLADPGVAFTTNQTTGAWSFTPATTEGAAYIIEVNILQYTTTPTVQRSLIGVYLSAQGSYRVVFPTTAITQLALVALLSASANLPSGDTNAALISNQSTTNAQGSGGPTIIALVQLVCKASGIFDWAVAASSAAAAAADVSTWTVTTQTGTGTPTYTGNTAIGVGGQFASGSAGTGIAITAGGGGELTLASLAKTIGTAAVGDTIAASGACQNVAGGTTLTPFTRGNNVFLLLKYTNSVANRAITGMSLSLRERLYA